MNLKNDKVVVTGMGVITPIGIGRNNFSQNLKKGLTNFSSVSFDKDGEFLKFPLAQTDNFKFRDQVQELLLDEKTIAKAKALRHLSRSTAFGTYCALEAWADAALPDTLDMTRAAIIASGSNTQQDTSSQTYDKYKGRLKYMSPHYGFNFLDTDVVGVLSELLGVHGEGHAISAASASGNMGIIQGTRIINSGEYDVVLVVAPLMDLSVYEYQGFTAMGAMASIVNQTEPARLNRPFDKKHCGFVYGQSAGCMVLESEAHAAKRMAKTYGSIAGYGLKMDANRNPNPSDKGEFHAMQAAIDKAGIAVSQIDYVNTHGTGSVIGDKMEVKAMLALGLEGVKANSTKSLIGHGITAAGMVEAIASFIQMNENFLHKSYNLTDAICDKISWLKDDVENVDVKYTLSNSFGFGGINTALVLKNR